jgi:biopolymer transport protein TolR
MPKKKHDAPEEKGITDINVTPLVDVCLVLVIIFMVTANFVMQAGIKVVSTQSGASVGKVSADETVNIIMTRTGKIIVNGKEVTRDQLPLTLSVRIAASKDKVVTLVADNENRCAQIVDVLDCAKQNGAIKLSLMKKMQQ